MIFFCPSGGMSAASAGGTRAVISAARTMPTIRFTFTLPVVWNVLTFHFVAAADSGRPCFFVNRHPTHLSARPGIVVKGVMKRASVVPHRNVIWRPPQPAGKFSLDGVVPEVAQKPEALVDAHSREARHEAAIDVEAFATRLRVRADDRVLVLNDVDLADLPMFACLEVAIVGVRCCGARDRCEASRFLAVLHVAAVHGLEIGEHLLHAVRESFISEILV